MFSVATCIRETSTNFILPYNDHKHSIRYKSIGFPVTEHFNLSNHDLSHAKYSILFGNLILLREEINTK